MKADSSPSVIAVEGLSVVLDSDGLIVPITKDINFSIRSGEVLALVGESGSGKSVTALAMMQLLGKELAIADGSIRFQAGGEERAIDIVKLGSRGRAIEALRGAGIGMVFQEPMSSFSPIHTIGMQIAEVVVTHERVSSVAARARVVELLDKVGIPDPQRAFDRLPGEFSGGMRQRAMIARALICRPKLLIADEPTTALDVTIQAQILELLLDLKREMGMAILFITHNMGIVAQIADRLAIMYAGRIVESGSVRQIFRRPRHPYSRALLDAVPRLGDIDRLRRLLPVPGSVPSIFEMPQGCRFFARCRHAVAGECDVAQPPRVIQDGHSVECILADKVAV
jgi:oligopeptide/dipeptide ABC transporter ATP-binding protein